MSFWGEGFLAASFVLCGLAVFMGLAALIKKEPGDSKKIFLRAGRAAIYYALVFCTASFILLVAAFMGNDFSIAAVMQHSSIELAFFYKLSAVWAGAAGSLLLWTVFIFAFFILWLTSLKPDNVKFNNAALSIGSAVCLGFLSLLIFAVKPFAGSTATKGAGLNPLLQNFWNVIHPPLLFIGYSAFLIPFVIILAAVFTRTINETSVYRQARAWLLFGICFLGLGIATGARWSYIELGWGGYWAWDPVENVSLLPWLTAIAALHCLVGMRIIDKFRFWAIVLTSAPFILCLVATFVTRSGILQSVHAFGRNANSMILPVFIGCCFSVWLICVIRAAGIITITPSEPSELILKKRNMLLWAVVILISTAAIIGAATFWPIISPVFASLNSNVVLTRDFYDRIISIAGILAAFLIGLAAVADFQRRSGFILKSASCYGIGLVCAYIVYKNGNNTPLLSLACGVCTFSFFAVLIAPWNISNGLGKTGSNITHFGLLLLVIAAGFSSKEQNFQSILSKGGIITFGDKYKFVYDSFRHQSADGITQVGPEITVRKDGCSKKLWPHNNLYPNGLNISETDVYTDLFEDIYLVFDGITKQDDVIINIKLKPLMLWLWISLLLIAAGPALGLFAGKGKQNGNEARSE